MKCYKQMNADGELVLLLKYDFEPKISDPLMVEITQEEYEALIEEINAVNDNPDNPDDPEIPDEEALDIILGVSE